MEMVLSVLRKFGRKMTEAELAEHVGPIGGQPVRLSLSQLGKRRSLGDILYCLLIRNRVRCDSFDPSKRGGQAGVRRWGISNFTALWEAVESEQEAPDADGGDGSE